MRYRRGSFSLCLFLLALLVLFGCGRGGSGPHRLADFSVEFGANSIPTEMTAGERVTAEVVIKNTSKNTWPNKADEKGHKLVNLSYHWLDRRGDAVVFDGLRTPLPHDVATGESVRLNAVIQAPDRAGKYTLEVTLVQEAVAWFPERGGDKLTIPVAVVKEKSSDLPLSGKRSRAAAKSAVESKPSLDSDKNRAPGREKQPADPPSRREKSRPAIMDADRSKAPQDPGTQAWTVQVHAFPQRPDAEAFAKNLRAKNHDAYIVTALVNGREWHRVRVGRVGSRSEAQKLQELLKTQEGLTQSLVTSAR